MLHQMAMVDGIYECEACGRRVSLRPFEVLAQGDAHARHSFFSTPAPDDQLKITAVVSQQFDGLDPEIWGQVE